jgi:hypothetical protein
MTGPSRGGRSFPMEDFVQSVTAQLDRAQDALALKARTGRPLTFALKDLSLDLRVFCESDPAGRVLWRHASPNEEAASTVRLTFTSITKSMVEENTVSLSAEEDPRAIDSLGGSDALREEDRERLERVGVRTVGQLQRLSAGADPKSVETYLGIPVMRLQAALQRAAKPAITGNEIIKQGSRRLLKVHGVNLSDGALPEVRLSGEPVEVLEASAGQLLVRPLSHHVEGPIEVFVTGERALGFYDVGEAPAPAATPSAPAPQPVHPTPPVAPLAAEEPQ